MNPIPSNSKIKYFLLSILFTILFIFTAFIYQNPITAHATDTLPGLPDSSSNGSGTTWLEDMENDLKNAQFNSFTSSNGLIRDSSTGRYISSGKGESGEEGYIMSEADINGASTDGSVAPKYLYWAGDSQRSGILFYVIDLETNTVDQTYNPFILVSSDTDSNGDYWQNMVNCYMYNYTRTGEILTLSNLKISYQRGLTTPVLYSGDSWYSNGDAVKGHMLSDDSDYTYTMIKYWKRKGTLSDSQLKQLVKDLNDNKVALAFETVSAQSFFLNSNPASAEESMDGTVLKAMTTAYSFAKHYKGITSSNITGLQGSTANWKWFQAVQASMILEEDMAGISHPTGNTTLGQITVDEAAVNTNGYGIMITTINMPPIHTYDETKGTPGAPETPSEDNGTTGDCTIKKLYYTQVLNPDGTVNEEKDFKHFEMSGTTNYISIDTENGYEIEGWKTSSSEYNLTNKSEWDAIPDGSQHGTSSDTIKLEDESGCLYVLYKKVEQLEEEDIHR
jgi:hypothetical protein